MIPRQLTIFQLSFDIFHLPFCGLRVCPTIRKGKANEHSNEKWKMENDKWKMIRLLPRRVGVLKQIASLSVLLLAFVAAQAQVPIDHPGDPQARVIDGVSNSTVFGLGQSIRITGTVRQGAIAFGGDVIVEGTVDGDVAAIGGSVIQREGSRIGGDVIVVGGIYYHGKSAPGRDPQSVTIMYAQPRGGASKPGPGARGANWTAGLDRNYGRRHRVSSGVAGSDWRVDLNSGTASGFGGHRFRSGGDFRRDGPVAAASLSVASKIGIGYIADGRRFLGRDGFPALRLAHRDRRFAGNQSRPGADGTISHQLEEAITRKLDRSGRHGHLVASAACGKL